MPPPSRAYWKLAVFAFLLFGSLAAAGQSISGSTTPVLNQIYTYSFYGSCQSATWYVSSNATIVSQSASMLVVRWNASGISYVRANGTGCSGGSYASLDFMINPPPPPTITISGRINNFINHGVSGVSIGNAITDNNGNYTVTVSAGYSGTLTPSLIAHAFNPPSISYSNITSNQINQNYTRYVPFFCEHEPYRSFDTPNYPGNCFTGWRICQLPSNNGLVWKFTNWDNSTFEQNTITYSYYLENIPCGGRNTFKSVCVRAVGTSEWICFNY